MDTPPMLEPHFEEESFKERIYGLGEMFPDSLRRAVVNTVHKSSLYCSWIYSKSRALTWIVSSSLAILVLPISLESERQVYEQQMERQKRNILLGPDSELAP